MQLNAQGLTPKAFLPPAATDHLWLGGLLDARQPPGVTQPAKWWEAGADARLAVRTVALNAHDVLTMTCLRSHPMAHLLS